MNEISNSQYNFELEFNPYNFYSATNKTDLPGVIQCKVLAEELINYGYDLSTNGTDNHLILVNLNSKKIKGSKIEKICEKANISINKNSVPGDKSALSPGGIRLGTPSLTTRGFKEEDFVKVANLLHKCIQLAIKIQTQVGTKLSVFVSELKENKEVIDIRNEVIQFASRFPLYDI